MLCFEPEVLRRLDQARGLLSKLIKLMRPSEIVEAEPIFGDAIRWPARVGAVLSSQHAAEIDVGAAAYAGRRFA